jgi:hypothetical protein
VGQLLVFPEALRKARQAAGAQESA